MKILLLVFLHGFIILTNEHYADANSYKQVKLTVVSQNDKPTNVLLKRVQSFLANDYLPMWSIKNTKLYKLNSKSIMKDLGPFTTFHDPDTSSAAVYYHKRFEFDGVIDVRYVIEGLYIGDDFNGQYTSLNKDDIYAITERKEWGHLDEPLNNINQKSKIPKYFSKWVPDRKLSQSHGMEVNPHKFHSKKFFIETLVLINYDMTQELLNELPNDYTTLVSYIITLFNNVDMLFSKLHKPKLKINIAGIIIGHEPFHFLTRCYQKRKIDDQMKTNVDPECTNNQLMSYFQSVESEIPHESYDVMVFLTRYGLSMRKLSKRTGKMETTFFGGLTGYPPEGAYKYKQKYNRVDLPVTALDGEKFEYYPSLAHEMIHSLGVFDHDDESVELANERCNDKIMKPYVGFCKHCLEWSSKTKNLLTRIFRSPNSCIFINKPHSLYPPKPHFTITADEQCQCYGYKSEHKLQSFHSSNYCNVHLQCKNEDDSIHDTLFPMDGTPCNDYEIIDKVCWNRNCEKVKKYAKL